jgi:hypothetical protein
MASNLEPLVQLFADNVIIQSESESVAKGNKAARKYLRAWDQLIKEGDAGRDALSVLLAHPHPRVRIMATAFLLRYKHKEATTVLIDIIQNHPNYAFGAEQCLKRWEEGAWQLDPEPETDR